MQRWIVGLSPSMASVSEPKVTPSTTALFPASHADRVGGMTSWQLETAALFPFSPLLCSKLRPSQSQDATMPRERLCRYGGVAYSSIWVLADAGV